MPTVTELQHELIIAQDWFVKSEARFHEQLCVAAAGIGIAGLLAGSSEFVANPMVKRAMKRAAGLVGFLSLAGPGADALNTRVNFVPMQQANVNRLVGEIHGKQRAQITRAIS